MSDACRFTATVKSDSVTDGLSVALSMTIEEAKRSHKSDRVAWTLVSLSGVTGGFIPDSEISVIIEAERPD